MQEENWGDIEKVFQNIDQHSQKCCYKRILVYVIHTYIND